MAIVRWTIRSPRTARCFGIGSISWRSTTSRKLKGVSILPNGRRKIPTKHFSTNLPLLRRPDFGVLKSIGEQGRSLFTEASNVREQALFLCFAHPDDESFFAA